MKRAITLVVNGDACQLLVQPRDTLLRVLRDSLGLIGTKEGCGNGNCGTCTVLLDGQPVNSCLVLAAEAEGHAVTTVEGLAQGGHLLPLQQAFIDHGGLQCGFCTPGIILTAYAFLDSHSQPTELEVRQALAGNLCRCTGYDKVVRAVLAAATGEKGPSASSGQSPALPAGAGAIGQRLPRTDGVAKVTGQAAFGADMQLPGMLYGKVLRSPHPHARIKRLDLSRALALEGVKGAITGADLPPMAAEIVAAAPEMYVNIVDHWKSLLASDEVVHVGQGVAAVAAIDPHIAEDALGLIQVEYEPLPVVEDVLEAMNPESPVIHPELFTSGLAQTPARPSNIASYTEMGRGDVEAGFKESDVVIEQTYRTQMVHQGYLEPQAAVASVDTQGKATVWTSTQGHFDAKQQLCDLLSIPYSYLKVVPMEVGGGFGGKSTVWIEPLCVLLARQTGRPVKMVLTREEVFKVTGPGAPAVITVKAGAGKDGKLKALAAKFIYDAGAFPGSPAMVGAMSGLGPYRLPSYKMECYDVVTNKPWVKAYRAPGTTQAAFAIESHMDVMAEALGLDPVEFRLRNAVSEGDLMPTDRPYNRIGLRQLLEKVAQHSAWTSPDKSGGGSNRGRGMASGLWFGAALTSSAQVTLNGDGSLAVMVGTPDITGSRTSLLQIASDAFGIPVDKVSIAVNDTESGGFSDVSGGSRTIYSMGTAVYRACQDAIAQLKRRAAAQLQAEADKVEYDKGSFRVRGSVQATDRSGQAGVSLVQLAKLSIRRGDGPVIGKGSLTRLAPAPAFAAHIADVEVDPETGKVKLLSYTAFQDVGRAINPTLVEGQMQGAATQGIGWALSEGYMFDKGMLLNSSLMDYHMPTATDVPFINTEIVEVPAPDGPYGVRGVGEVPIVPPPAAIANAIYKATGVRIRELPINPERLFRAIKEARGTS